MNNIVVVGAGLAGLSAAKKLAEAGHGVTVFEQDDTIGGRVKTRYIDGFTLDRGFQVLFTDYPAAQTLLNYDALDLRIFSPGAIMARPGERSVLGDPRRDPRSVLASVTNSAVSLNDIVRAVKLWRQLRRKHADHIFPGTDQSILEYLTKWGFSQTVIDEFIRPFYGGITLDPSLSTSSAIFEYTAKMLVSGDIAVPADGMIAIPNQLAIDARESGATISTGMRVERLESNGDTATVETTDSTITADAVVVATDPPTARSLTGVESIPSTGRGCITQYYSLPSSINLRTKRRLLLNTTGEGPNHVADMSTVAPEYAPADDQLLAATYLGERTEDNAQLAATTKQTLAGWYPEYNLDELTPIHTDRISFAQFDQPPGVHAHLPASDDPSFPIYLAGDYTQWSSIQGALQSGIDAAEKIIASNS